MWWEYLLKDGSWTDRCTLWHSNFQKLEVKNQTKSYGTSQASKDLWGSIDSWVCWWAYLNPDKYFSKRSRCQCRMEEVPRFDYPLNKPCPTPSIRKDTLARVHLTYYWQEITLEDCVSRITLLALIQSSHCRIGTECLSRLNSQFLTVSIPLFQNDVNKIA